MKLTRQDYEHIDDAIEGYIDTHEGVVEEEEIEQMRIIQKKINQIKNSLETAKETSKQIRSTSIKLPNKKLKLENKMEFKDYLEKKEIEKLDEGAGEVIGSILGYATTGLVAAFGGTLLILGGIKAAKGLKGLWQKIFRGAREVFNPSKIIGEIKTDARVNKIKQEMETTKGKYDDELKYVYLAITNKDFTQAREEFEKIPPVLQNNPDVHKSLITEITKTLKQPPIYLASPGNKTYQAIKRVINIRVARAAAAATEMALKETPSDAEE